MNQRLDQSGEPASVEEPTVKVGGDDIYEARCRDCHEVETDE
jgi:thymidine kinase